MRSEITWARKNRITPRVKYCGDHNGNHWTAGKPAVLFNFGCTSFSHFTDLAKNSARFLSKRSLRGSKLKHAVVEMTAHAQSRNGSTEAFRLSEQERLFWELVIQFGGFCAVGAAHGTSDLHCLIVNRTYTGKALRASFTNNATPRRVMVAICDRLEDRFNLERAALGLPALKVMTEVRNDVDTKHQRRSMTEQIARELIGISQEPLKFSSAFSAHAAECQDEIAEMLNAMQRLGWKVTRRDKVRIRVSFAEGKPWKDYFLDQLRSGVGKSLARLRNKGKVPVMDITPTKPCIIAKETHQNCMEIAGEMVSPDAIMKSPEFTTVAIANAAKKLGKAVSFTEGGDVIVLGSDKTPEVGMSFRDFRDLIHASWVAWVKNYNNKQREKNEIDRESVRKHKMSAKQADIAPVMVPALIANSTEMAVLRQKIVEKVAAKIKSPSLTKEELDQVLNELGFISDIPQGGTSIWITSPQENTRIHDNAMNIIKEVSTAWFRRISEKSRASENNRKTDLSPKPPDGISPA